MVKDLSACEASVAVLSVHGKVAHAIVWRTVGVGAGSFLVAIELTGFSFEMLVTALDCFLAVLLDAAALSRL